MSFLLSLRQQQQQQNAQSTINEAAVVYHERLAQVLRTAVREVDRVGRYGGEEFIVLMPETARDAAAEVAERVRRQLAGETFTPRDEPISLTLSIGVSSFPADGETVEAVIDAADQALYKAKHEGRDRVVRAG